MPMMARTVSATEMTMPMGVMMANHVALKSPAKPSPAMMGPRACITPMPTREPMVLKMVNRGRWLGSLVSTDWADRVTEVWKV